VCSKRSNSLRLAAGWLLAAAFAAGGSAAAQDGGATSATAAKATPAATTSAPPKELTEEERELQEMLSIVEDFQEQTKSYKKEVQLIIERKYEEQRKAVVGSYNRAISELEEEENQRRLEAIAVFEKFLAKYPDDASYTPGALWRLAELYYEKSKVDYSEEEDQFDSELAAFNRGETKVEPLPPMPHFEGTISLLQRLIQGFPNYNLVDGAYYLLAYCLQEQGESDEAQASYVAFIERFPKSKFLPEIWTRLGESYFEDPDKLDKAIDAYLHVLAYPDSRMFDKALYKLAWTYYKVDRFQEAVERFDQLISWSDAGAEETAEEGELTRGELRKEAMQYLSISFAEDDWEGSGVQNARAFFHKLGGRGYEGEFYRKVGEVYFVNAKYDKSIEAYRESIRRYPLDPDNPKLMGYIVDSYFRLQQPEQATKAQEELIKLFGPDSKWRKVNKDNPEALAAADKLAENALYTAAVRHHTLAQRFKEAERPEEARHEYDQAAKVYAAYLTQFPDTRDAYKLTFYLAECHYYSLDFKNAAVAYTKVRDSAAGTDLLAESANSVVLSYINLVKEAEAGGQLGPLKVYTSKDRPKEMEIKEQPIPELRKRLIEACDVYVEKLPTDEQSGNMAFRAARIFYAYDHLEKARERFSAIVAESKDDDLVTSSINLIIESYLVTQDWGEVETWSRKLAALSRNPQQKKALKEFELGARFNKANQLMAAGKELLEADKQENAQEKLDSAAEEFTRLVNDDPRGKTSDKALNNAALCYTWSNRPISAGRIYERIVKDYPRSEFADQALFLMAGSAETSYQFQRAIDNYLKLVNNYKDSKFRADSLYNASVALEGDQQYLRAAKSYERYAKLFKDRPDAADNFFRAGVVLEKQKAWRKVIDLYGRFTRTYRRDPAQREKIVQAQMKIAEAWAKLDNDRKALKGYREALKLYHRYRLPEGGRAAEAAAKAKFLLIEVALEKYEDITFEVHPRKLKKTLDYKAVTLKKMEDKYKTIFDYKRVQWTLASYYRMGYLYENFANVLVNSPCPRGLNQEECDVYKAKLEDFAEAPIKKAVEAYQLTMEKSAAFKVVNDWTEKAYESLNRYEPLQFPLQKEPEEAMVVDRHAPLPMLRQVESGIKPSGK
jgi:TolA-binding protein